MKYQSLMINLLRLHFLLPKVCCLVISMISSLHVHFQDFILYLSA
uniref:Uncharacterized protein n=1 Tax=Arundo donax TaxID=35708 RepID=A0A0A9FRN1_ARUDO